jgi:mitochondrial fission protein ELM1
MGYKAGDNAQVLALAEALGWPFEIKHVVYRKAELLSNLLLGGNLLGVSKHRSSDFKPPWPDLVITAGRRNEPIARWIQRQAEKRVRLVHIGRPWARLHRFDLIVTTPQYLLPPQSNILHNTTILHRVDEVRLSQQASLWAPRLAHLPRPYIAVLIGGDSGPYVFDEQQAQRLGSVASAMASAAKGALLLTTSARTSPTAIESLSNAITCPVYLFKWTAQSGENPYFAYLALADAFIVTGESVSMLTEACSTRKPVYIFDSAREGNPIKTIDAGQPIRTTLRQTWRGFSRKLRYRVLVHRLALWIGPRRMQREFGLFHQMLISTGRAVWFGQDFPAGQLPPPLDDLPRAVTRVRRLFAHGNE